MARRCALCRARFGRHACAVLFRNTTHYMCHCSSAGCRMWEERLTRSHQQTRRSGSSVSPRQRRGPATWAGPGLQAGLKLSACIFEAGHNTPGPSPCSGTHNTTLALLAGFGPIQNKLASKQLLTVPAARGTSRLLLNRTTSHCGFLQGAAQRQVGVKGKLQRPSGRLHCTKHSNSVLRTCLQPEFLRDVRAARS